MRKISTLASVVVLWASQPFSYADSSVSGDEGERSAHGTLGEAIEGSSSGDDGGRKPFLECKADFSFFKPGAEAKVRISSKSKSNKVSGSMVISGAVHRFKDAPILDYKVGKNISLSHLSDEKIDKLNDGEKRLSLLLSYMKDPQMKAVLTRGSSFDPKDVTAVRIYDLGGDARTNMFGGTPLVEFLGKGGKVLGRFMQGVALSPCI